MPGWFELIKLCFRKSRSNILLQLHFIFSPVVNMQSIVLKLFGTLSWLLPTRTAASKLLHRRFQLSLQQREIIHAPHAQDTHAREVCSNTIHQRTASATEVVGHFVVLSGIFVENGVSLSPTLEVILATKVLEMRVVNGEVSCVDGGGEFMTIGAVANESADESRTMSWLEVTLGVR